MHAIQALERKQEAEAGDAVAGLVRQLAGGRKTTVLVVDDSPSSRMVLMRQLAQYGYAVLQAQDGIAALEMLEKHPEVCLMVTDYSMPRMDGFELVRHARARWARDRLAIIGLSATGDPALTTRFLQSGANDFLPKPFVEEEFRCRVTQNVEMLEYIRALREAAVRDFLTGLHNRRYFFDAGARMHASARRGQIQLLAAMVDIDHFKRINDTWGHDAGDEVIRRVAALLRERFRETDIVARFGGEEFCVLAVNFDHRAAQPAFDELLGRLEGAPVEFEGQRIPVTASIGVSALPHDSLESLVSHADELLYAAKQSGRNRVALAA